MQNLAELMSARYPVRRSCPEPLAAPTLSLLEARSLSALAQAVAKWAVEIPGCLGAELRLPADDRPIAGEVDRVSLTDTAAIDVQIPLAGNRAKLLPGGADRSAAA